ncbi:MAG: response regulator receiver protein [Chitinophagaceae bacterium]|nr:response regulator receiver protein [Chitinophagaceae bacterium]
MALSGKPVVVFLADDDADDRAMFEEVIHEVDPTIQLTCAEDGKILLTMLQSGKYPLPQLLFLDLNMPNKNGKECLEEIRNSDRLKDIPVIIYSTSSSPKDIDDAFEKGANLYVRKPSSFQELRFIARAVLAMEWSNYKPFVVRNTFVFSYKSV